MAQQDYRPHDLKWLFEQIAARNISAFARFYDDKISFCYSVIHPCIPKGLEARNILLSLFLDLWNSRLPEGNLFTDSEIWLLFELRNRTLKYAQSHPIVPSDFISTPTTTWELDLQQNPSVFKALKASWSHLDRDAKQCMTLLCFHCRSLREIADTFGTPESFIKELAHASLLQLRAALGIELQDHEANQEMIISAELYALGVLSDKDKLLFQKEIASHPQLYKPRILEVLQVLHYLYSYQPAALPPHALRETLLDQLSADIIPLSKNVPRITNELAKSEGAEKSKKRVKLTQRLRQAITAFFILIFFAAVFLYGAPWLTNLQSNKTISKILSSTGTGDRDDFQTLLKDPQSKYFTVAGLMPGPEAKGTFVWNQEKAQGYLFTTGLPVQDPSSHYKLWVFSQGGPLFVGVVTLDERGESLTKIDTLPPDFEFQKFAVTLEDHQSPPDQPAGNFYLLGDVARASNK